MHFILSGSNEITVDLKDCIIIHNKDATLRGSGLERANVNFVIKNGVFVGKYGVSFKQKLIRTWKVLRILWGKSPTNIETSFFHKL